MLNTWLTMRNTPVPVRATSFVISHMACQGNCPSLSLSLVTPLAA